MDFSKGVFAFPQHEVAICDFMLEGIYDAVAICDRKKYILLFAGIVGGNGAGDLGDVAQVDRVKAVRGGFLEFGAYFVDNTDFLQQLTAHLGISIDVRVFRTSVCFIFYLVIWLFLASHLPLPVFQEREFCLYIGLMNDQYAQSVLSFY